MRFNLKKYLLFRYQWFNNNKKKCPRFWPQAPPQDLNPNVHWSRREVKANTASYQLIYECFLVIGWSGINIYWFHNKTYKMHFFRCSRFWHLAPDPARGMDPGIRGHEVNANPVGKLWSKYECFVISNCWDIHTWETST